MGDVVGRHFGGRRDSLASFSLRSVTMFDEVKAWWVVVALHLVVAVWVVAVFAVVGAIEIFGGSN